jgi:hypothetical protein
MAESHRTAASPSTGLTDTAGRTHTSVIRLPRQQELLPEGVS